VLRSSRNFRKIAAIDLSDHHVIQPGESLSSVAYKYGFFPETIWLHANNEELRASRSNPNALQPGDKLFIPHREAKSVFLPAGRTHRFRRRAIPEVLTLRLLRVGRPWSGEPYELEIDGVPVPPGTTDADGFLRQPILPSAREGVLRISGQTIVLKLGHLQPNIAVGARQRLTNLGFDCGAPADADAEERLAAAVRAFQQRLGLEVTGRLDAPTLQAIEDVHDHGRALPVPES
jgi:hypothetical protein